MTLWLMESSPFVWCKCLLRLFTRLTGLIDDPLPYTGAGCVLAIMRCNMAFLANMNLDRVH